MGTEIVRVEPGGEGSRRLMITRPEYVPVFNELGFTETWRIWLPPGGRIRDVAMVVEPGIDGIVTETPGPAESTLNSIGPRLGLRRTRCRVRLAALSPWKKTR